MLMLLAVLALLSGGAYLWLQGDDPLPAPTDVGANSDDASRVAGAGARGDAAAPPSATAGDVQRDHVPAKDGLAGRLLQGGEALAGVTVIACQGSVSKAEELHRAVTDAHGVFHVRNVGRRFWLAADGERVPHHWHSQWIEPADDVGDISVVAPGSIAGVVRDEAGSPIAGAKLTRVISSYQRVSFGQVSLGSPVQLTTTSDERGQFRFERVAKGQGQLRCQATGYQLEPDHEVEIDVGEDVVTEIVLRAGMTLRGLVMDHVGHPLQGATVTTEDAQETVTDALGQFTIEDFRRYAQIDIRAEGHLPHQIEWLFNTRELQRVKLERAATLRGVVSGANGQPGTVYVEPADTQRPGASRSVCYEVTYETHDIVRDGRFVLPGFALADFDVTVRIPGVGVCGPMRVELRGDREFEFVIVPQRDVVVSLRNADGEPIVDAELVRDDGIVSYPQRYGVTGKALVQLCRGSYTKRKPVPVASGTIELGVPVGEGVAFYVEAPGYLRAAAAASAAALPERMDVVMARAGSVRGIVHGGMRQAYGARVSITALDAHGEEIVRAKPDGSGSVRSEVAWASVQRDGGFAIGKIAPGSYRAQVARGNTKSVALESTGISLIDEGHDARATTDFVVQAGHETNLELTEPLLGRLIGRVLLRGSPVAGAMIVATRAAEKEETAPEQVRFGSFLSRDDWDNELVLGDVAGQRSGKDGAFEFLYRDAGPVEVRVRHVDGLVTSSPFIVNLPAPGRDVVRDFELPAGEIRGRYDFESLDKQQRKTFTVTLFPANKTLHDPFFHSHHGGSLAWGCPKVEKSPDGSFRFGYLRPGQWLARAYHSGDVLLWQKLLDVHNDVVDVGDLPVIAPVAADVKWSFAESNPGRVRGVWLRDPQAAAPIWAGTFAAVSDSAASGSTASGSADADPAGRGSAVAGHAICKVIPGKYLITAFGGPPAEAADEVLYDNFRIGLTGEELCKPVPIEIRSDGSVLPNPVRFSPLPRSAAPTDHK
tara:strand:+ start:1521 stop:4505 length:2985 start_codon:yes stop_codon:yes gene_type:complete